MSKAILVVEDDDVVRMLTTEVLEEFGYQVLSAEDAEQALRTLAAADTRIDLLLTDVGLPGMSGPELARQALTLRPELAILFASGYVQGEQLGELGSETDAALNERCAVIGKPFSLDQIRDKVAGMIGAAA